LLPERFEELDYRNREVYVTLERSGPVWKVQDVSNVPPAGGKPYLKGQANGREIRYGIEKYYIPEGKGKNVPNDLYAQIVIQPGGIAQLKKLYSDGTPLAKLAVKAIQKRRGSRAAYAKLELERRGEGFR
jgi:GDYXXLXY protein